MLSPVTQRAAMSGGVDIPATNRVQFIAAIQTTAHRFGLAEVRDHDLETGLSSSEHRVVYSAHFVKDHRIGLVLSNDISETRFSYMLFKEPFRGGEFVFFQKAIDAITQKYRDPHKGKTDTP